MDRAVRGEHHNAYKLNKSGALFKINFICQERIQVKEG